MQQRLDFVIAGVQKGGTTALDAMMRQHPSIQMPSTKELHFFDDETVDWSDPDMSAYHRSLDWSRTDQIRGEATPIYTYWPQSLERIKAYHPNIKLIITLRHPIHRAFSHWRMETTRGAEDLPFHLAIRVGRERIESVHRVYSYVERGFYAEQIERVLSLFSRDQVLFLKTDTLWSDQEGELARITSFLGIEPFHSVERAYVVPLISGDMGEISDVDHDYLQEIYQSDLEKTASLTGLDLSSWIAPAFSEPMTRAIAETNEHVIQLEKASSHATEAIPEASKSLSDRPNILVIVADDLNSWIGALGSHPDVQTPNIDALARRGTLFTKAYCPAPYCNASRMSVFTGCMPSTTGIYQNETHWEAPSPYPNFIEHLRHHGYYTFGAGKVFHGTFDYATAGRNASTTADWLEAQNRPHIWDDFRSNISEPLPSQRPQNGMFDFGNFDQVPPMYHHFDWGPISDAAETEMPDEGVVRAVTAFLANAPQDKPFFCAAGLYKPHLPWHVPQRFFDMYDVEKVTLPLINRNDLDDVPEIARQWALSPPDHEVVEAHDQWRAGVRGYLACISYCDWMVGRIMKALDEAGLGENTIVALWGDNGFHLGEKLHWRKFVLWEEATRVPMIVTCPTRATIHGRVHNPVSIMDLFPTLCELSGVPAMQGTDALSLLPLIEEAQVIERPAIMTWGKGNHSIRLRHWRYTVYVDGGEELYDHACDPHEWTNLAKDASFAKIKHELIGFLPHEE